MKKICLLLFLAFLSLESIRAATGWYNDFVKIDINGIGTNPPTGWYWIGLNPSYGTELNGVNFGTIASLIITGCDMKYWSDNQDRTGGAFYYKIMASNNTTQVVAPVEIIWDQTKLGGNDYQGVKSVSINLFTGLSANTTYKLHIWAKHWGSTQGDNYLSNYSADYVATFTTPSSTIFSGTGSWSSTSNWSLGIPSKDIDATINGSINIDVAAETKTLTINSGNSINIGAGKSLTVTGTLTNSAGITGLVIKSDATGTGSLITSSSPVATVERYLVQYNSTSDKMFHFISSPVSNQAIRTEFVTEPIATGQDFYSFDEVNNSWINSRGTGDIWNTSFENNFTVGKGYLVAYPSNVTKNFSGTLNSYTSLSPLVFTCTNTVGKGDGWNLLGNPFPSAMDWDYITANGLGGGMDNALYYYDNAVSNYKYYIRLGSYGSLGSGQRYIPAMQGFMVHAKTSGTKTVTIDNNSRSHNGQNVFYKSTNAEMKSISLKAMANGYEDETVIYFLDGATTGFDGIYDAFKLNSYSENVPMISSTSSDGNELAINGLPAFDEANVIPVNFKAGLSGDYTLHANLSSFNGIDVYLTDKKLNQALKISDNPVYNFTSEAGDDPNRFELSFLAPTGLDKPSTQAQLRVYATNGKINVSGASEKAELMVRNMIGQVVLRSNINNSAPYSVSTSDLPEGVYVVSIISGSKTESRKVVVKR